MRRVEIQGHRGAKGLAPENTLPGFRRAFEVGVDAIEFDVTCAADGGLILSHDLTVDDRTKLDTSPATHDDPLFPYIGKKWAELTLPQIATLDAGSRPSTGQGEHFRPAHDARVPRLPELCALVAEAPAVTLAVEIKTHASWPARAVRDLTRAVLLTLNTAGVLERSRILAFDWRVLVTARDTAEFAHVPRVALIEPPTWVPGSRWLAGLDPADFADPAEAAARLGAAWLSPCDPMTTRDLIEAAAGHGLKTAVWTVNDPARMRELMEAEADGIVTDRPDILRDLLAQDGTEDLPAAITDPAPAS